MNSRSEELNFDRYASILQDALEYTDGTHTLADVREGIDVDRLQFWPGVHSAVVTEVAQYPHQRHLHFFLAAGRLPELEAMFPVIREWGRSQGCTRATLVGRAGWTRSFLRGLGWRPTAVVMEADI